MGDLLAAGDACAAAAEADDLVHRTMEAVQAGQVPPPLQEDLLAASQELLHGIECVPQEPAPPAEEPPPADPGEDEDDEDDDDDDDDD